MVADNKPLVTIAIPTYNRLDYLLHAIESARRQTYEAIEIIVSDNDSSDGTREALNDLIDKRLIVLTQQTNIGMMPNWNKCLEVSRGEYFILLSDDDYLEPTAIESMVNILKNKDDVGAVCCVANVVDENGNKVRDGFHGQEYESGLSLILAFLNGKRDMFPCKILMRTGDIRQLGGYPGQLFPLGADAYIWMSCVLERYNAVTINEPLSNYRIHTGSTTQIVDTERWVIELENLGKACKERLIVNGYRRSDISKLDSAVKRFIMGIIYGAVCRYEERKKPVFLRLKYLALYGKYFLSSKGAILFFLAIARILTPLSLFNILKSVRSYLRSYNN